MSKSTKNTILITIECLRTDHMHYLGYPKEITPTLDTLAKVGSSFPNAFVTYPWTPASFKSLLTSRYPLMDEGVLQLNVDILPRKLKSKGYKTAAIGPQGWFNVILDPKDFDLFYTLDWKKKLPGRISKLKNLTKFLSTQKPTKKRKKEKQEGKSSFSPSNVFSLLKFYAESLYQIFPPDAKYCTEKANSWIENNSDKKFFLWIHFPDPHGPYYPSPFASPHRFQKVERANRKVFREHPTPTRKPGDVILSEEERKALIGVYDKNIQAVDHAINSLIKKLLDLNILKETGIIVTGDHGQEFLEHGGFGHGLQLYNEAIRVPLIIVGPNIKKETIDTPVSLIDLPPTILDILDINQTDSFIGSTLLDEEKRTKKANQGIICEEGREKRNDNSLAGEKAEFKINKELKIYIKERKIALVTPKWKYIYNKKGEDELYNYQVDPKERKNIREKKPNIASRLKERVKNHIQFEKRQSRRWRLKNRIKKVKKKI